VKLYARPEMELDEGANRFAMSTANQGNPQKPIEPPYAAFLAIDWADEKHAWNLQEANAEKRERGEVEHTPEAIEAWVAEMSQRFSGRAIAVAVEQSRGALVFLLSKYEQLHIFSVPRP